MPREPLDEEKATQVAARLLRYAGGSMDELKFIKVMYLIDREALLRWSSPITNDVFFSLPAGPVQSGICDLVRHESRPNGFWKKHIATQRKKLLVKLVKDPGAGRLSEAEEALIDELSEKYKDWRPTKVRDFTHKLPEWKDPGRGSIPIEISEILQATRPMEEAEKIARELASMRRVRLQFAPSEKKQKKTVA